MSDGTWTYKPPTLDIIPQSFNVELYKSPVHKDRIFSAKGHSETLNFNSYSDVLEILSFFIVIICSLLLVESHITYPLCLNVTEAVGEPPLLLAGSVYSAIWSAIRTARKDYKGGNGWGDVFEFNTPATMDKVKKLCGMDNVEKYLAQVSTGNLS